MEQSAQPDECEGREARGPRGVVKCAIIPMILSFFNIFQNAFSFSEVVDRLDL
jgi:hypothetical protein